MPSRSSEHMLEELLVLAAQDGDAAAFNSLLRRVGPRLERHAQRLMGDPHAAEEVTQEAWLAIIRTLRRLDDPSRFRAWAFRIVTVKAADWVRSVQRRRRSQKILREREPKPGSSDLDDGGARSAAEGDEAHEHLRRAIRALTPDLQSVVGLHYGEGMSINDVAHVLDLPPGTVKSRLHAARRRLKELIERNPHEQLR